MVEECPYEETRPISLGRERKIRDSGYCWTKETVFVLSKVMSFLSQDSFQPRRDTWDSSEPGQRILVSF